jgi:hypothetical protein
MGHPPQGSKTSVVLGRAARVIDPKLVPDSVGAAETVPDP